MQFSREINRILFGTLVAFLVVGVGAAYWAISGPDTINLREDNPRTIETLARIQRGTIYDRNGITLAETVIEADERVRKYYYDATYSLLGYYSLRYGEGGAESAFNALLNGSTEIETLQNYFDQRVLKTPPVGSDVQLTVSLDLQQALVDEIEGYRGAGVIMNAQNGNILALASLPTFDSNTLDDDWDELREAPGNPFFNRVLQGQYQPGGIMYTLWMAQAILTRYNLTTFIANGADAVSLNDLTITCVREPDIVNITLEQAYTFGCPVPFAVYLQDSYANAYPELIRSFSLNQQITLNGFPVPEPITPTSSAESTEIDSPFIQSLRNALGQGNVTVTPLHVAGILSAIAHNGNAPQPNVLLATREPDSEQWASNRAVRTSIPLMTSTTNRQLRNYMQANWQVLQPTSYPAGMTVGASVAVSYSGEETQVWIYGFIRSEQSGYVAFVIVLEDTSDTQAVIPIGQTIIAKIIETISAQ